MTIQPNLIALQGLIHDFGLRDRAGAISMIKKGALVDKTKN